MNLIEAYKLIEEDKPIEAYEALSSIIDDKKEGLDARYARAMLDIFKLKKYIETTIDDLLYFINKKTKYHDISYSFLTLVYDELEMNDEVIKYGKLAFKYNCPFKNEVLFALSRALANTGKIGNLEDALTLINTCLDSTEDDNILDYLVCKSDILITLDRFTEAKETIDKIVIDFGHSGITYYLNARLNLKEYQKNENKDSLDDCINNANICLQYENNDYSTKTILIEAYTLNKDYDKALELIDSLKNETNEEDIVMEKLKIYDSSKDYKAGLSLIDDYLSKNEKQSWKVLYMKGVFLYDQNSDNINETLKLYKESYKLFPTSGIMVDIHNINMSLNNEMDTFNFINETLNIANEKGFSYFTLAEIAYRLNFDYDEIRKYYYKAYVHGYLTESEYLDSVCNYTKDPKELNKVIKKMEKSSLNSKFAWTRRKLAIRYIYKEDGYKQNLKKAKQIIESCLKDFGNDACTLSLYGICLLLMKDYDNAYKYILKSYEILKQISKPECYCAYGYLSYLYLIGYGTEKNEELAKEIILDATAKEPIFTCSHIVSLYVYFYLNGDSRFDGNIARQMLENNYPFYRYDISRLVLLSQVVKKQNYESKKLDELLKDIKYYSKEDLKYYNENINKVVSLPFWRNI